MDFIFGKMDFVGLLIVVLGDKNLRGIFIQFLDCVFEKVQQMGCTFLCTMIICIAATHKCPCWKNMIVGIVY